MKEEKKQQKIDKKVDEFNRKLDQLKVSPSIEENLEIIDDLFKDNQIIKYRRIVNENDSSMEFVIVFCEALVDHILINDSLIKPLILTHIKVGKGDDCVKTVMERILHAGEIEKADNFRKIVDAVCYGDSVIFISGCQEALYVDTKKFSSRTTEEPPAEMVLSGPREGFNENIMNNMAQLQKRIRSNDFKCRIMTIGERTKTICMVCYINSLVNKNVLDRLFKRLESIQMDGILDPNYLIEMIKDNSFTPFRVLGLTERPDSVVGKLLEGRIALLIDGSPVAVTMPYLFMENFQSPEDYYVNYYYASFSRLLRLTGFILTLFAPALYISIVAFHHELLPVPLLIHFAIERSNVPFPAAVEAFLMIGIYELIRETGIRVPSNIGQALSIVGALVIGQAAVDAKLIAAPMVIVVAITALTGLLVPKLSGAILIFRPLMMLLASFLGLYGFLLGASFILAHLLTLRSMGVIHVSAITKLKFQEVKDLYIRAPWWKMRTRPMELTQNKVRMKVKRNGK